MKLVERPDPVPAINDVVVQVYASGFVGTELAWPSTWTDRVSRNRTPSIPGHEFAGVVTALGYGTTGLSVGQRAFGITESRDFALSHGGPLALAPSRRSAVPRDLIRFACIDFLLVTPPNGDGHEFAITPRRNESRHPRRFRSHA
nr:alcohol dehydrogenase catalytic domain-containing protein [Variovorax paradoxus]